VYGEDCNVLIEQFGLIPTFNRAVTKHTEAFQSNEIEEDEDNIFSGPVTRDVELPREQNQEPVEALSLTPPEPSVRLSNDPREKRKLAEQSPTEAQDASTQAKDAEVSVASAAVAPIVAEATQEAVTSVNAEPKVDVDASSPETISEPQVNLELASEEAESTSPEKADASAETHDQSNDSSENSAENHSDTEESDVEKAAQKSKSDADKSSRPRRPRGRPPKKASQNTDQA
jgi:ribonuclease E